VGTAGGGEMVPRDRICAALHRRPVDRPSVDLWVTPEIGAALRERTGSATDLAMFQALRLNKIVGVFPELREGVSGRCGGQAGAGVETAGGRTTGGVLFRWLRRG